MTIEPHFICHFFGEGENFSPLLKSLKTDVKNSFKGNVLHYYCAGARLKLGRRFRNHKMSIWQSLIPSLENIGRQSSLYYYPSEHSTLQLQGGAAVAGLVPPANVTAFRLPLSCPKVRSFIRRECIVQFRGVLCILLWCWSLLTRTINFLFRQMQVWDLRSEVLGMMVDFLTHWLWLLAREGCSAC